MVWYIYTYTVMVGSWNHLYMHMYVVVHRSITHVLYVCNIIPLQWTGNAPKS
jgi:hypothetical protein